MRKSRHILKEDHGYVFVMDPVNNKGKSYAAYVVGTMKPQSQAKMHKKVWIPLLRVVQIETSKLPQEIVAQLKAVLAKGTRKASHT